MKSLDIKLEKISDGSSTAKDFVIADAKDADMGAGRRAPGFLRNQDGSQSDKIDSFQNYLNKMQSLTETGLVDVMLMSATAAERLVNKKIFEKTSVTPAMRLHDTSCIWAMIRNGEYDKEK